MGKQYLNKRGYEVQIINPCGHMFHILSLDPSTPLGGTYWSEEDAQAELDKRAKRYGWKEVPND